MFGDWQHVQISGSKGSGSCLGGQHDPGRRLRDRNHLSPGDRLGFYRTGYSDTRIEPNRFRITFAGNTVTDRDVVERYPPGPAPPNSRCRTATIIS
ncbi:CC0125/CC1285 family lipoprotein [Sphingomonas sp. MMS24-JH45]